MQRMFYLFLIEFIIKSITSFSMYLMLAFTQKTKSEQHESHQNPGMNPEALKGKHFLLLIINGGYVFTKAKSNTPYFLFDLHSRLTP
jgi:hypothetical protein